MKRSYSIETPLTAAEVHQRAGDFLSRIGYRHVSGDMQKAVYKRGSVMGSLISLNIQNSLSGIEITTVPQEDKTCVTITLDFDSTLRPPLGERRVLGVEMREIIRAVQGEDFSTEAIQFHVRDAILHNVILIGVAGVSTLFLLVGSRLILPMLGIHWPRWLRLTCVFVVALILTLIVSVILNLITKKTPDGD